jgi:integrase
MEAFLGFKEAERKSPRTLAEYRSLFNRLVRSRPRLTTSDFDGNDGAEFLIAFVEGLRKPDGSRLDDDTSRKYYSMLATFTGWLVTRDKLIADPGPKLPHIRKKRGAPKPIPEKVFQRLLEAAPTASDRLALLLMGRCGLRRAELRGVRLRDFDLGGPLATVHIVGKGNKPADQPLLEIVRLEAERVLVERPNVAEYLQYPVRVSNLPHERGKRRPYPLKPLSETGQDNWWAAMLSAADVPPAWTMHQLRHTAGTHFYGATRDPQQTQHFMRHEKMDTTFEYYVAGSDEARLKALAAASAPDLPSSVGAQS